MITIKHVAAGLLALAMLTTSAVAREVPAGPSAFVKGHAAAAGRWGGGPPRMAVSRSGEFETLLRDQPGGVCDHGDNAMIC
ncbi:hypothetical protein HAP47_0018720 [Bradyrhizobium sp. 41S5]|uniref:hypothetical protein n=1 Tax=Bradyrhizobium sp. 41S5 TaxID=1404443 RepID=UPI00156B9E31|nr:hypothetical protein [Bradyrhizobium sp. 41S5]UFX48580.1 hypothetical protein HAP47_0018720 [Bradyrhizobium sp. 41S5]